ncbi:MAG: hypothetical protein AAFY02_19440 [Pseudomonadota bacterium]
MRVIGYLALVACVVGLAACAKPARVAQMSSGAVDSARIADNATIQGSLELGPVTGGEETNPLWTSEVGPAEFHQALDQSLQASGLLAVAPDSAPFVLTANLVEMDQPLFGADVRVTSTVDYEVTERVGGAPYFKKTLVVGYTADFSDALLGVERLRLANEGSIRVNISAFVQEFVTFWIENPPAKDGMPLPDGSDAAVSLLQLN